jgi:hypothetical protein
MGISEKDIVRHMKKGQMNINKDQFKIKKGQML